MGCLTFHASAFDVIDETEIWPNVVQGHHSANSSGCNTINSPQITINPGSDISGTQGNDLVFCSINTNNGLPNDSCDTAAGGTRACTVTGSTIEGLKMNGNQAFQSSNGSAGSIGSCNSGEQINLGNSGATQFNSLSLFSDCTVTFSSANTDYRFNAISAGDGAVLQFPAGDYWIKSLQLDAPSKIEASSGVRIFISDSSQLNGGVINSLQQAGVQVITYNDLTLNGKNINGTNVPAEIYADIYSENRITLNTGSIFGRVTAKYLTMNSDGHIGSALPPIDTFHIQYGKATSNTVTFDDAFPAGVTPLVFLMPTITDTNANNDGPASVALKTVSENGFTWEQQEPPSPSNRYVASNVMPEVHWIAVTSGIYDLPNGTQLIAGRAEFDQALIGSNNPYIDVALPSSQNVLLNQMQTQNNNCWFTSTSQFNNAGIQLAMDTSEVRSNNNRCQPGNLSNNQIQPETIAYLTVASGSGSMVLNGENTNYHFGNAQTHTNNGIQNLNNQCNYTTPLTGFTDVPMLVAGKTTRRGGDGGWLRRCQLSNSNVSMVIDEDTYRDSDRGHIWERYSFIAIEKLNPVIQCFTDDFNRSDVGDDWVVSTSQGSFTPAIVNNRLRVTEARGGQATSSTYQRLFPAAENIFTIEFDHYAYGGSGADGIAFVLSDSEITPQAGAYGGPLGYGARSTVNGFAGGWLGFGIDEYGNFSAEGGPSGPGRRRQSVAIRGSGSGTSGYPYLRGSCANGTINPSGNCLSPTVDNNNVVPAHRYRITVDSQVLGQSIVSVERNTGAGFEEVIPAFDVAAISSQSAVPDDFLLSITGSTGGATNNHEIDNVEICALKSAPIGVVIDHFEFDHTGSGLTCGPETLTIKACANADCSQTVPDFVTATLSPATVTGGGGWVGGNVVSFSGGSTTLQLNKNTPGTVTIDVIGSSPGAKPFSETLCSIAGGTPSAANCTLTFDDSGFVFDVPDKLANKPETNIIVSAVKKDDITQQCVPSLANVSKNIDFWSTFSDPNTSAIINPQSVTVNNTAIGQTSAAATTIPLAFNAQGQAEIEVNYPDAGKVQLDARYTGSGDEDGLVMLGDDQFVSFPVGLCVTPEDSNAECTAGNSSCNVYKKAGESFNLQLQAKAWQSDGDSNYCDNLNTPNYAHDNISLDANLVAPSGGVLGSVSNSDYNHVANSSGTNTVSQSISEVGVFQFTAKPPATYLGSSFYSIPQASSVNVGRFVPDRFVISGVSVIAACNSFSYMDQPFAMSMNISAFNTFSAVTQNYQHSFAKGNAQLVGENNNDGVELSNRLSALPVSAGSWVAGVATVDASYQANFARTSAPNVDGPFSGLDIGVQVFDNDGDYAFVADPDMRADISGDCTTPTNTCNAKRITQQDLRHGRVIMDNTYGPENEILEMPVYAQYWNGAAWGVNVADSCSVINAPLTGDETYSPALGTGETVARSDNSTDISNGEMLLYWQNTGSNPYRGQVKSPLVVDTWLQWYWNYQTSSPNLLVNPEASAFFGRYRGHDRVIYWQEVSQ
ncbi:DUF6701 domain-containing protein [Shewanella gaetbuli]|uniref:MSHA biogenesis protein MshQ n=1 Tax=Shewanella gaetbuli TaxID=220752 RepID=A0A9X1ZGV5_9GAMM|nr:DUF6701 domain-containing protein [Shewanella gaetbuli]MCL1142104.1 MSHA biogenesis protein MshQ [Shewanella gaetbuli]